MQPAMPEDVVRVHLSSEEYRYLLDSGALDAAITKQLRASDVREERAAVDLPRSLIEPIRAALTVHLAKVGFDPSYAPTPEGQIIESLIDRFHRAAQDDTTQGGERS